MQIAKCPGGRQNKNIFAANFVCIKCEKWPEPQSTCIAQSVIIIIWSCTRKEKYSFVLQVVVNFFTFSQYAKFLPVHRASRAEFLRDAGQCQYR